LRGKNGDTRRKILEACELMGKKNSPRKHPRLPWGEKKEWGVKRTIRQREVGAEKKKKIDEGVELRKKSRGKNPLSRKARRREAHQLKEGENGGSCVGENQGAPHVEWGERFVKGTKRNFKQKKAAKDRWEGKPVDQTNETFLAKKGWSQKTGGVSPREISATTKKDAQETFAEQKGLEKKMQALDATRKNAKKKPQKKESTIIYFGKAQEQRPCIGRKGPIEGKAALLCRQRAREKSKAVWQEKQPPRPFPMDAEKKKTSKGTRIERNQETSTHWP